MLIETETKITACGLGANEHSLTIVVRHDSDYEYGFVIKLGCQEEAFTSRELRTLVKCFNKALRVRKAAA